MESKKINQLATNVSPQTSDLTIIGDPTTGVSKKITLLQIANLFSTIGTVTSVGVTETGDALTITGSPITSAGTINIGFAGDATQYVRGDGALADFPTSTGGGSSVSYYLNSSVSQGTIGGVAYRELSKEPIIDAGTDITISANGYVASYITDANDPSLLEVPGGNFNCEFYFSVNSNNHNPYVYAELYKYDGTTFTLLGSSQSVPEYLSNGTTLSPYYFAIPVATAALTITDRLAVRIYVNVDTKVVTLHTENSHLCQVVTTFSKGLISLNNLTRQNQFFGTGTSGTDFAISSSVATHTFNLPVASATNTGKLSSTDWSNFNTAYNRSLTSASVTGTTTKTLTLTQQDAGTITASWTDDNTDAVTSVFGRTGAVVATEGDYSLTQLSDVTITSPSSGQVLKYNGTAWINDTDANTGTVTSVAMSVPTGLSVSGSPITSSGTLGVTFTAGYSIPTNASQTTWDTAYTNRITSASFPLSISSNAISISLASASTAGYLSIADWNTFNGKQNALTNPVTGTGNAGNIALFTGTSAIGNSIIVQSGTNIGIMNATPSTTLDVTGGGKFSGSITALSFIKSGGTSSQFLKGDGSVDSNTYITATSISAASPLFYNSGTGVFTISAATGSTNGYLSSADWLTFTAKQGAITLTTTGTSGAATLVGTTLNIPNYATDLSGYVTLATTQTISGAKTFSAALSGTSATFSSSVTATAGIFNLNTTNGGFKITAVAATPSNLAYLANNYFAKFYTRPDQNYGITIFDQNEATAIQSADLVNGTNARALILNPYGGNVLIGTTTDAGYKLDVNGTGRFYNTGGSNTLVISGTGSPYKSILDLQYSATVYGATFTYDANPESLTIENYGRSASETTQGDINFRTKVNNTTPTNVLNLDGFTGAATFSSTIGTAGDITITKASAASFIANNTSASGKSYRLVSKDDGNFTIQNTGVADLVTITSGGSVGIGTTAPASTLSIGDAGYSGRALSASINSAAYAVTFRQDSASGLGLQLFTSQASWGGNAFTIDTSSSTLFRITSGGNVGIGTSSPSEKLDLQGTMNMNSASGTYLQIQYNGGNRGYLGTANATIASGSTGDLGLAATSNLVFGSGGSLTERMRITSAGNVLVGTTTDGGQKLQVNGITKTNSLSLGATTFSSSTTMTDAYFFLEFTGGAGVTLTMYDSSGNNNTHFIKNSSSVSVSIAAHSGGVIMGLTSGTGSSSITLGAFKTVQLISRGGSAWYIMYQTT